MIDEQLIEIVTKNNSKERKKRGKKEKNEYIIICNFSN